MTRTWDTGLVRPYRPRPDDFRATFIAMGWDGIDEHYRTNWRVIRRWMQEEGREELIAERSAHVRQQQLERRHGRIKKYIAGGRGLTAVKRDGRGG
jgi:hypothetical protein